MTNISNNKFYCCEKEAKSLAHVALHQNNPNTKYKKCAIKNNNNNNNNTLL